MYDNNVKMLRYENFQLSFYEKIVRLLPSFWLKCNTVAKKEMILSEAKKLPTKSDLKFFWQIWNKSFN